MIERLPWTQRVFRFDLPPAWIHNILSRLSGTGVRMRHLVNGLSEDNLCYKPDGKWSIKEEIGHLADLESLHISRLREFSQMRVELTAADMSNKATEIANHNNQGVEFLLDCFDQKRKTLIEEFRTLEVSAHQHQAFHPRLKLFMRPVDLAYFAAEHDDHHVCSMELLLASFTTHQ